MKNYYDLLEIEKTADERQIKSAYFKMVRKYTPERFPEEFKKLRAAYDTLSDAKSREEYDRANNLPSEAAFMYAQAQKARREGRKDDAINILEMVVKMFPELQLMWFELARSYEEQDKTGKAIQAWEKLCKLDAKNSHYSHELAQSYRYRGWHKKALDRFGRTVELDPNNAGAWMELISLCEDMEREDLAIFFICEAVEAVQEKREGSMKLFAYAFGRFIDTGDKEAAEECMIAIIEMLKSDTLYPAGEREDALYDILDIIDDTNNLQLLPYFQQMMDLSPEIDEDLLETLNRMQAKLEVSALEGKGYADLLPDLLEVVARGCDCQNCKNKIASLEASIIHDLPGYRPHIERLKQEEPQIYAKHAAFFDEVLKTRDLEKMLYYRIKELARHGLAPNYRFVDGSYQDDSDTDSEDELDEAQGGTYRREEPKIGRNDPCPCGSGKKFKKCCGA